MASINLFDFKIDSAGIKKQIVELSAFIEKQVSKIPDIKLRANLTEASKKIDELRSKIQNLTREQFLKINPDFREAISKLRKLEKEFLSPKEIKVRSDISNFKDDFDFIIRELKSVEKEKIKITADISDAKAKSDLLFDKIKTQTSKEAKLKIHAETKTALIDLDKLDERLVKLDKRETDLEIIVEDISPKLTQLERELEEVDTSIDRINANDDINIKVDTDITDTKDKIDALNKKLKAIDDEKISIDLEITKAESESDALFKKLKAAENDEIKIKISSNIQKVQSELGNLDGRLARLDKEKAEIAVLLDTTSSPEVTARIKDIDKALDKLPESEKIKIKVDEKAALNDISKIDKKLSQIPDEKVKINLDTKKAASDIKNIDRKLSDLPETENIKLTLDLGNSIVKVNKLEKELSQVKDAKVSIKADIGQAQSKISKIESDIKGLADSKLNIDADIGNALKGIDKVESKAKGIPDTEIEITADNKKALDAIDGVKDAFKDIKAGGSFDVGGLLSGFAAGGAGGAAVAGIGALTGAISGTITGIIDLNAEIQDTRRLISQLASVSGSELDEFSGRAMALADTFDKDVNDVVTTTNNFAKQMGISFDEAFGLVESGFVKGADSTDEFLDKIREYPVQFKSAGLSAEDFIKAATVEATSGVFSDKFLDTIKEAGLRLREFTPAVKDAISAAFGEDFAADIKARINDGTTSTIEAFTEISKKAIEAELPIQQYQTLIADVTGGAGEDLGGLTKAYELLIKTEEQTLKPVTEFEKQQNKALKASQLWNTGLNELFGAAGKGFGSMLTDLKLLAAEIFSNIINAYKEFIAKNEGLVKVFNFIVNVIKQYVIFQIERMILQFKLLTLPIRLTVQLIARLVSESAKLINKFLTTTAVGKEVTKFFKHVEKAATEFWEILKAIPDAISDAFDGLLDLVFGADEATSSIKGTKKIFKEYFDTLKDGEKQTKALESRLKFLKKEGRENTDEFQSLTNQLAKFAKSKEAEKQIEANTAAQKAWGEAVAGDKASFDLFIGTLKTYSEQTKIIRARMSRLRKEGKGNTIEFAELNEQLKNITKSSPTTTKSLAELSKQLAQLIIANKSGTKEFKDIEIQFIATKKATELLAKTTKELELRYKDFGTGVADFISLTNDNILKSQEKLADKAANKVISSLESQKAALVGLFEDTDAIAPAVDPSQILDVAKQIAQARYDLTKAGIEKEALLRLETQVKLAEKLTGSEIEIVQKRNEAGKLQTEFIIKNERATVEEIENLRTQLNDITITENETTNAKLLDANETYLDAKYEAEKNNADRLLELTDDTAEEQASIWSDLTEIFGLNEDKKTEMAVTAGEARANAGKFIAGQLKDVFSKDFEIQKAFNIAESAMNTYQAATNAYANIPFPFNIVAAGIITGLGLLQIEKIRNTKPGAEKGVIGITKAFAGRASARDDIPINVHEGESLIPKEGTLAKGRFITNKQALEYARKGLPIETLFLDKLPEINNITQNKNDNVVNNAINKSSIVTNEIVNKGINTKSINQRAMNVVNISQPVPVIIDRQSPSVMINNSQKLPEALKLHSQSSPVMVNISQDKNYGSEIYGEMQRMRSDISDLNKKFDSTSLIKSTHINNVKVESKVLNEIKNENYL